MFPLHPGVFVPPLVRLHENPSGQYHAQVVGIPEIHATAATSAEALAQARQQLTQWLAAGQLVPLGIPPWTPPLRSPGWAANDALEQEYLEDLARSRQEDLERTLREY
jgi:predicted RNase H-like HicB family nuclease